MLFIVSLYIPYNYFFKNHNNNKFVIIENPVVRVVRKPASETESARIIQTCNKLSFVTFFHFIRKKA